MKSKLRTYQYEILLISLINVIFNKIFFTDNHFYIQWVWPFNMIALAIAASIVFREKRSLTRYLKDILAFAVVVIPFIASTIFSSQLFSLAAMTIYILFYVIIFYEVMFQITKKSEVTVSIILGSLSGYLLIIIIAIFSFLLADLFVPHAFNGIDGTNIPAKYNEVSYFAQITLSSIGYGDITPAHDSTRLLASFWGIVGQFYMVAVVGIIIAKYTSKK